jgi:RNA polymerase sigma-70 factor (family 1)
MVIHPHTNEELLKALGAGSEEAFLQIYEHYWYKVFAVAYKRLRKKEVAEELTQDLFLKLWEKREQLKWNKLENYLFASIKNAVIDHINSGLVANKYTDHYTAFVACNSYSTQNIVAFNELTEEIEKGLAKLPSKSQQVFKLSRLDNWTSHKIAKHLHLSEKTVGYHLTKSLKFIRTYLREYTLTALLFISV